MEAGDDGKKPEEACKLVEEHGERYKFYSSPQTHEVDERLENSLAFISQRKQSLLFLRGARGDGARTYSRARDSQS